MNFDRLAPCYRALEFVAAGNQPQRCRIAFLDSIPAPRRVLIAGEGNGRFLREITRRFPAAAITVLDSSRAMLDLAKSRVSGSGASAAVATRIEFVHTPSRPIIEPPNGDPVAASPESKSLSMEIQCRLNEATEARTGSMTGAGVDANGASFVS